MAIRAGTFGAVLCSARLETSGDRVRGLNETTTSGTQSVLCIHIFWGCSGALDLQSRSHHPLYTRLSVSMHMCMSVGQGSCEAWESLIG